MQQPQTAAAAAASSDIPPCTNSSLTEHSLSQEVPHKPPYVLRCGDRHLVGRVQFAGGVLSEKRHSQKNPVQNKTTHGTTTWQCERKEEVRKEKKTQNEKLQRNRRLWNGNKKSKQSIRKKVNNQTATKPLHRHNWDKTKTFRTVHP